MPENTTAPDAATIKAKLLADPNTKAIAEKIGVDLNEYVDQVVFFVQNPKADPQLYVVEDEDLRKLGMEPPDEEEMGRYVMEVAQLATATEKTDYQGKKKELVSINDLPPVAETRPTDEKLKEELEKQLRGRRGGKS